MFRIIIESRSRKPKVTEKGSYKIRSSVLNFLDLGSMGNAGHVANGMGTGDEGSRVCKSVLTLGKVLSLISEGESAVDEIPYRDSKLTRILKPALGLNSHSLFICTITPNYECRSTRKCPALSCSLQYTSQHVCSARLAGLRTHRAHIHAYILSVSSFQGAISCHSAVRVFRQQGSCEQGIQLRGQPPSLLFTCTLQLLLARREVIVHDFSPHCPRNALPHYQQRAFSSVNRNQQWLRSLLQAPAHLRCLKTISRTRRTTG